MRAKLPEPVLARLQEQAIVNNPIPWQHDLAIEQLETHGWCWVRDALSPSNIQRLVLGPFGNVVQVSQVRLDADVRSYLCDCGPVPIHTDHPAVTLVAWFCHAQDPVDGATVLLDSRPILARLGESARVDLRSTLLPYPALDFNSNAGANQVLSGKSRVFFAPWVNPLGTTSKPGYVEFSARLHAGVASRRIEVPLKQGDLLLVDNTRTLHGRRAVQKNSPRHLSRFWIAK